MAIASEIPCDNCNNPPGVSDDSPCMNCGAVLCRACERRTVKDGKFCMHCGHPIGCVNCGADFPLKAKYCPECGTPKQKLTPAAEEAKRNQVVYRFTQVGGKPSIFVKEETASPKPAGEATASTTWSPPKKRLQLEVHAREIGMAGGRSIVANLLGEPALLRCKLVAIAFIDGRSREIYEAEFLRYAGRADSIETLGGMDRESAQEALEALHKLAIRDGWEPVSKGTHWYSYRYEKVNER
jgi:hypothetical protein